MPEPDKPTEDKEPQSLAVQKELDIPDPAPIAKKVSGDPTIGTVNAQYNYNVNLPAVQLPSWEEFSKYPQDVREFLMRVGEKEQDARHTWIVKEQDHRHTYDHRRLYGTFDRQKWGQLLAFSLSVVCITAGTAIIIANKNPLGFVAILAGITPLIAMAAYAKNIHPPKMQDEEEESHSSSEEPPKKE